MKLYDTIKIKIKCPVCSVEDIIEFKTISIDNKSQVFTPGDRVSEFEDEFDFLELTGVCKSEKCLEKDSEKHGTVITAKIRLRNGIITNDIYDIDVQGI